MTDSNTVKTFYIGTDRHNKGCITVKTLNPSLVGELRDKMHSLANGHGVAGCFSEDTPRGVLISGGTQYAIRAALPDWQEMTKQDVYKSLAKTLDK